VTTFGSHPWEASHAVPGGETVYFLWSPAARRPYLEAYRLLQLRRQVPTNTNKYKYKQIQKIRSIFLHQERLLTRPQLDSALEGSLPLAVNLVPRYSQPAALRAAVLRALAGRLPGAGAVPALGLPRPLQEELQALL
jgi:hypothetical protein